jgi:hypothetical protein
MDQSEINDFLMYIIKKLGFDHISIFGNDKIIYTTYPIEWVKIYKENKSHICDQSIIFPSQKKYPYHWGEKSINKLSTLKKNVFIEARKFDINSGIAIPILGEINTSPILNLATKEKEENSKEFFYKTTEKFILSYLIYLFIKKPSKKETAKQIEEILFNIEKSKKTQKLNTETIENEIKYLILKTKHNISKNYIDEHINDLNFLLNKILSMNRT